MDISQSVNFLLFLAHFALGAAGAAYGPGIGAETLLECFLTVVGDIFRQNQSWGLIPSASRPAPDLNHYMSGHTGPGARSRKSRKIMKIHDFSIFSKLLKTFQGVARSTRRHHSGPGEPSGDLSTHHECPKSRVGDNWYSTADLITRFSRKCIIF